MTRRVTVHDVLQVTQTVVERLGDVERRLAALEQRMADVLHPLASQHRYELANRLQMLERCVDALQDWAESWNDSDDDGESWKRGGV